jgi:flagellar biosynthesis protein FliP
VRILAAFILAMLTLTFPVRGQEVQGPGLSSATRGTMGPTLPVPELSFEGGINPLSVFDAASKALPGGNPAAGAAGGDNAQGPGLSPIVSVLVMLTVISLAPAIMLMTTCFVRIIVVLGLLKQAMGTQTIPPAQVTTALALFMTMLVMSPTIDRINAEAIVPYQQGQIRDYDTLWDAAKQPMRDFMFAQIDATGNWSSVYMVLDYRGVDTSEPEKLTRADVDMVTLVPAFLLSELKTAFIMGFRIYLPFLVIDMVISTILISMSMMMLPPVMISLPFKLLLFVMVDGWQLITGSLMRSFEQPAPSAAPSALSMLGSQVPIVQPVLASLASLAEGVRLVA